MKKLLFFLLGALACSVSLNAQGVLTPFEDWSTTAGTQNFFHKGFTRTVSNYVYVAGATVNGAGDYDIFLSKTSNTGVLQWAVQYDGLANYHDMATDVYVDASNNVYITGVVVNDTVNHYSDCITIKYNSSGVQQWVATYNGTGSMFDAGAKVIEDGSGNVYVCGGTYNSSLNKDYLVIKYNSSGTQQWAVEYNGTANLDDAAVKVGIASGKLVVLGVSQATGTTYKPLTLQMNLSTGAIISATYSSSSGTNTDIVNDVYKDASGNFYLVGGTPTATRGYDFTTIKLTAATMAIAWQKDYNSADSLDDIASGVQVDGSGNVYVTGYTTSATQQKNMLTIKYNSSGTQQWLATYNDTLDGNDEATSIVLDASNNSYVSGYDSTALDGTDYYTIKYNSSGTEIWNIRSDGDAHLNDKITDNAIDTVGNIIVTGESQKADGAYEYKTVRYVEKSVITPTDFNSEPALLNYAYYENKGQIISTDSTLVPRVRYYTRNTYPAYYVMNDTLALLFPKIDTIDATQDTLHKIDMSFENCNSTATVYHLEKQSSYLNYYLAHCPEGITEIHGNQRLVIPDLYNNIDLIYSSNAEGMKYYFIVKPGGDYHDIEMKYHGASSTSLNTGTQVLTINASIGSLSFDQPISYQINTSNLIIGGSDTLVDWVNNGSNSYSLSTGSFNPNYPLIIEIDEGNSSSAFPAINNMDWSTYYGGSSGEEFEDVKTDNTGKVFVAGYTVSFDFPIRNGIQTSFGGTADMIALRFNAADSLLWATFYGGPQDDEARAVGTDASGNVFFAGYAGVNFPHKYPGGTAYCDSTYGGGSSDGAIVKLGPAGFPKLWGTYYGGNTKEEFNDMNLDKFGNVYLGGDMISSATIDLLPSATAPNDTVGLGLISKFKIDGTAKWLTRFGGSATSCAIKTVSTDANGRVVIGGLITTGGSIPILNNGANGSYAGGSDDGFLTKFDNDVADNALLWSTYMGGASYDAVVSVTFDGAGNVICIGNTSSDSLSFPLTDPGGWSYYQGTYGGGSTDVFVSKFAPGGSRLWSSYFGGSDPEKATDVCTDAIDNIYVTALTNGSNSPIPSPNLSGGYFDSFDGGMEGVLTAFTPLLKNVWTAYIGGNSDEYIYSCAAFSSTRLYTVGGSVTDSTNFPIVSLAGAYNEPNRYGNNATIAGFNLGPVVLASVNEASTSNSDFGVFPNPAGNSLNIFVNSLKSENVTIRIVNILGQEVYRESISNANSEIRRTIDVGELASGVYVVKLDINEKILAKKIIKQ
jgi:hypothetical protein